MPNALTSRSLKKATLFSLTEKGHIPRILQKISAILLISASMCASQCIAKQLKKEEEEILKGMMIYSINGRYTITYIKNGGKKTYHVRSSKDPILLDLLERYMYTKGLTKENRKKARKERKFVKRARKVFLKKLREYMEEKKGEDFFEDLDNFHVKTEVRIEPTASGGYALFVSINGRSTYMEVSQSNTQLVDIIEEYRESKGEKIKLSESKGKQKEAEEIRKEIALYISRK